MGYAPTQSSFTELRSRPPPEPPNEVPQRASRTNAQQPQQQSQPQSPVTPTLESQIVQLAPVGTAERPNSAYAPSQGPSRRSGAQALAMGQPVPVVSNPDSQKMAHVGDARLQIDESIVFSWIGQFVDVELFAPLIHYSSKDR